MEHSIKELKFIHITKCAGSSIEEIGRDNKLWWGKYNKEYGPWHELFSNKSKQLKDTYDWFMVVRNPYDRILSEYYCKWGGKEKTENNTIEYFNQFLINKIKNRSKKGDHYTEQYLYLDKNYKINILKFENIEHEFNKLMNHYNLDVKFNKHINKGIHKHFNVCNFSEELLNLINTVYKKDFEEFGYSMILDHMLTKLDNLDCFRDNNYKKDIFESLDKCIKTCEEEDINIFIICDNIVYYKKEDYENCIKNIVYVKDSTMYFYKIKLKYSINNLDRINKYTIGIDERNTYISNKALDKTKFLEELKNINKNEWKFQHYHNLHNFIGNLNFNFLLNHKDLSHSVNIPTFVKSRNLKLPKKSVILPLEDLYIPSFYENILLDDIPFYNKLDNCVWRGANSGNFNCNNREKASRYDLVYKYSNHKLFNIGLSYANYKTKNEYPAKNKLSLKEQLKYKFIISVEGNDFATNLAWIMLSNSVVIMPKCTVETWKLESYLIEYEHYIPVENDFNNLETQMNWCINNLDKCEQIAFNSRLYILQFFDKERELYIINEIIKKYSNNVIFNQPSQNRRNRRNRRGKVIKSPNIDVKNKKYVFVCGLHRSGTSTITKIIGSSNLVSMFTNTNVSENEGQHIQSVYDPANKHGGPGQFGFDKNYHYTENSELLTTENNNKIINEWSLYWDLSKHILIEKSPPNVIHTRYLQEIVNNPYFIILIRHPFVVGMATLKWNKQSLDKHIEHWLYVHSILYNDLNKINKYLILKYEDLHKDTFEDKINIFLEETLSIDSKILHEIDTMKISNKQYFENIIPEDIKNKYENEINKYGYTFNEPFIL